MAQGKPESGQLRQPFPSQPGGTKNQECDWALVSAPEVTGDVHSQMSQIARGTLREEEGNGWWN